MERYEYVSERDLRELTRDLGQYDKDTIYYLARQGVTLEMLRRVIKMNR